MLALDYLIPLILTPPAINAQVTTLNLQYTALGAAYKPVPMLDNTVGVVNIWDKAWSSLVPPVVGYEVGFMRESGTEVVLQGKNRDDFEVFITCVAQDADERLARQQAAVYWEAIRMVLDNPTAVGLEGQLLPNVVPIRGIVKIGPRVGLEMVTVDMAAAGKKLGFRSVWVMTLDTVRP